MKTKEIQVKVGDVYSHRKMNMDATVTRLNPTGTQVVFTFDGCECVLPKSQFLRRHVLKVE